jgi:hypothetical protein
MWGTTSPCAKLTGDSHNGFETALIGDCRLFLPLAENQPQCLWGLLQHYQGQSGKHLLALSFSAFGPRLCENSDVQLARRKFVSITLNNKRTALAVAAERRKERKQSRRGSYLVRRIKNGSVELFSALPHP